MGRILTQESGKLVSRSVSTMGLWACQLIAFSLITYKVNEKDFYYTCEWWQMGVLNRSGS